MIVCQQRVEMFDGMKLWTDVLYLYDDIRTRGDVKNFSFIRYTVHQPASIRQQLKTHTHTQRDTGQKLSDINYASSV